MRKTWSRASALCAMAVVIATTTDGQDRWETEVVSREGTKPELALDADGQPHIAYMTEALVGAVFYASRGDSWTSEILAEGYFYAPMDILVDVDGLIHIAYHDHDFQDLAYAVGTGDGDWNVANISHPGHDGWDPSIAVEPDGTVHILAIDPSQFGSDAGVELFSLRGGVWSGQEIGSGPIPYEFGTGLVADDEGRLHAVYHDGSEAFSSSGGGDLYYAVFSDDRWSAGPIDSEGDVGKFASLALDSFGRPHIAYLERSDFFEGRVKYAHHNGDAWEFETIDTLTDLEIGFLGARRTTEVAVDALDRVYLAYSDRGVLKFARKTESEWEIEEITGPRESGFALGQFASLDVEANGRPHIAYYELPESPASSTGTIYYTRGPVQQATAVEEDAPTPSAFELGRGYPNPFNAGMVIPFTLPSSVAIEIAVYNLEGQRIRVLANGQRGQGSHTTRWDGRDSRGREVGSGVYAIRLVAGEHRQVRKALLIR